MQKNGHPNTHPKKKKTSKFKKANDKNKMNKCLSLTPIHQSYLCTTLYFSQRYNRLWQWWLVHITAQPICMWRLKDTESDTRQTWKRSACPAELMPLMMVSENRKSRCVRALTLSNPLALTCDPTRDEVVAELRIQRGGQKSERCPWYPVAKSIKYCTMSCGITWSNHDGAEPCTSADEKNACQTKRLGKATSDLRQGRRLHVWAKKVENYVSGVFPNLRGALSFVVESQDVVTAAADALGVPELWRRNTSRRRSRLREPAQVTQEVGPAHGGTCTKALEREILSSPRAKLPELTGAIGRMEDLVRRMMPKETSTPLRTTFAWVHWKPCCRMISKNTCSWIVRDRRRMLSWDKKSKHTVSVQVMHMLETRKPKGLSHPGGSDPTNIGAFGKDKGKHSKGKHGKRKSKGKQRQQGQQGQKDKNKDRDKNKESVECWNCGKRNHYSKDCWSKKDQTNKDGSKGTNKNKNTTDAHNLDSMKPANSEPEVEIGGLDMSFFNLDAVDIRESGRIKIGVDTGAGFLVMRISPSAQPLENVWTRASVCTLKVATIGESISEFEVSKRLGANHCCLFDGYTTMGKVAVMYGDKGYLFHKGSNVAKVNGSTDPEGDH